MPFTLAHAATAVPIQRTLQKHGNLSAFIISTFSPDLPYFLPLPFAASATHTPTGLFLLCLPITFVSFVAFYALILPGLHPLLPQQVRYRIAVPTLGAFGKRTAIIKITLSALLGATTHIVWDSFTHARAGETYGRFFTTLLLQIGGYDLYVYKLLQHLSGLVGLFLIAWALWRWYWEAKIVEGKRPFLSQKERLVFTAVLVATPILVGLINGLFAAQNAEGGLRWLSIVLARGAFVGGMWGVITAVIIALIIRIKDTRSNQQTTQT